VPTLLEGTAVTDKPLILAVETSSRVGSVALAQGPHLLEESGFSAPMQHSAEIFPAIERLLQRYGCTPQEIDQVHISIGPGSFTGLRIAVTLAKIMHLANGARIVTIDSLDVVAANVSGPAWSPTGEQSPACPETIVALFDAKRGQFYAAAYDYVAPGQNGGGASRPENPGYRIPGPSRGTWEKVLPDCLLTAREIRDRFAGAGRLGLVGDGLLYHRDEFPADSTTILPEPCWSPHAANVHLLGYQEAQAGRCADPLALTPFYLRGPQVTPRKTS
jgi:tRNA threonylcarbamoyladenosine biosynthesis protein TsaB